MTPENDFKNIPYAPWLENALRELINFPVKGICMFAITKTGDIYSNYNDNISMADKLLIAGLIQQDAMLDQLTINGFIDGDEKEDNDEQSV